MSDTKGTTHHVSGCSPQPHGNQEERKTSTGSGAKCQVLDTSVLKEFSLTEDEIEDLEMYAQEIDRLDVFFGLPAASFKRVATEVGIAGFIDVIFRVKPTGALKGRGVRIEAQAQIIAVRKDTPEGTPLDYTLRFHDCVDAMKKEPVFQFMRMNSLPMIIRHALECLEFEHVRKSPVTTATEHERRASRRYLSKYLEDLVPADFGTYHVLLNLSRQERHKYLEWSWAQFFCEQGLKFVPDDSSWPLLLAHVDNFLVQYSRCKGTGSTTIQHDCRDALKMGACTLNHFLRTTASQATRGAMEPPRVTPTNADDFIALMAKACATRETPSRANRKRTRSKTW